MVWLSLSFENNQRQLIEFFLLKPTKLHILPEVQPTDEFEKFIDWGSAELISPLQRHIYIWYQLPARSLTVGDSD